MSDKAFRTLGIELTTDGRAIRAAFIRLARIYHPDRFAGQPDDVRTEAERRMKEVTFAYESLRTTRGTSKAGGRRVEEQDLQERARTYRATIEAKRAEERTNRARWRRWQELELQARARADLEAAIAATIARDVDGKDDYRGHGHDAPKVNDAPLTGSLLSRRLDAARRGESAPLAVRNAPD